MAHEEIPIEDDLVNVPKSKQKTYHLTLRFLRALTDYLELMAELNDPLKKQTRSEEEHEDLQKKYTSAELELESLREGVKGLENIEKYGTPH